MKTIPFSKLLFKLLGALLLNLSLSAQEEAPIERKGLVLGLAFGSGSHFHDSQSFARYTGPNIRIGAMLNPQWALLLQAPGGTHYIEGEGRAFEAIVPSLQYWISDGLYVNGGLGLGIETTPFYLVDYEAGPPTFNTGLALFASLGQELLKWGGNKTVDLQLRMLYGAIKMKDLGHQNHLSIDLVLGINLY